VVERKSNGSGEEESAFLGQIESFARAWRRREGIDISKTKQKGKYISTSTYLFPFGVDKGGRMECRARSFRDSGFEQTRKDR